MSELQSDNLPERTPIRYRVWHRFFEKPTPEERLQTIKEKIRRRKHAGKDIDFTTVYQLLEAGGGRFHTELERLQMQIMAEDAQRIVASGKRIKQFASLEEFMPIPQMCGYAATALTENFREILGPNTARTVYGHYTGKNQPTSHYWTEMIIQGKKYHLCATYGQFDPKKLKQILFVPENSIAEYHLKEYLAGAGGTEMDEKTLHTLTVNEGNLPVKPIYDPLRKVFALQKPPTAIK